MTILQNRGFSHTTHLLLHKTSKKKIQYIIQVLLVSFMNLLFLYAYSSAEEIVLISVSILLAQFSTSPISFKRTMFIIHYKLTLHTERNNYKIGTLRYKYNFCPISTPSTTHEFHSIRKAC